MFKLIVLFSTGGVVLYITIPVCNKLLKAFKNSLLVDTKKDSTDSSFIADLMPSIPEVYADDSSITISPSVQTILTKFDNNDYTYPEWFVNNIKWVKDGTITSNEFLNAFNNLLQTGIVIDKTTPPVENKTISLNMVSQSIGAFKLENGKITGDIIYIAEKSFNPYYYNKSLASIVQIKDQVGQIIKLKSNNLNFTETERDERISINEGVGDVKAVEIEFYVWKSLEDPIAFSLMKTTRMVEGLEPCQIGYHRDWNNNCVPDNELPPDKLMDTLKGFLFGTVALSLLARK